MSQDALSPKVEVNLSELDIGTNASKASATQQTTVSLYEHLASHDGELVEGHEIPEYPALFQDPAGPLSATAPPIYPEVEHLAFATAPPLLLSEDAAESDPAYWYWTPDNGVMYAEQSQAAIPASAITASTYLDLERSPLRGLDEEVLVGLYQNYELAQHAQVVEEFRHATKRSIRRDFFFDRVNEYYTTLIEAARARARVKSLQAASAAATGRLWVLRKQAGQAEDRCTDGNRVSHTYASEEAQYGDDEGRELDTQLRAVRREVNSAHKSARFAAKMSKLWVQNYIDGFLSAGAGRAVGSNPAGAETLRHCLDVLFFFERRWRETDEAAEARDEGEASGFLRDVRGWITHLISALLEVATLRDHRYILLHVLRTAGIGAWGRGFVQWHPPTVWSSDFLDHYLTALHAFLGPVEELEEEVHLRDVEKAFVKEDLRRLNETDWVVVDEAEVGAPSRTLAVTILSEDDYLALFGQFNPQAVYMSFLKACLSEHRQAREAGHTGEDILLRLFAVTSQLQRAAHRGLRSLPAENPLLMRRIAAFLVVIGARLADSFSSAALPWFSELSYDRNPLEDPIVFEGGVRTSVQAEIDASIYRTIHLLLQFPRLGIWSFLAGLKYGCMSDVMKWKVILRIVSGDAFKETKALPPPSELLELNGGSDILTA
ncbi:hypothetical protein HK405_008596, partial [Cladochytrium tenue]